LAPTYGIAGSSDAVNIRVKIVGGWIVTDRGGKGKNRKERSEESGNQTVSETCVLQRGKKTVKKKRERTLVRL